MTSYFHTVVLCFTLCISHYVATSGCKPMSTAITAKVKTMIPNMISGSKSLKGGECPPPEPPEISLYNVSSVNDAAIVAKEIIDQTVKLLDSLYPEVQYKEEKRMVINILQAQSDSLTGCVNEDNHPLKQQVADDFTPLWNAVKSFKYTACTWRNIQVWLTRMLEIAFHFNSRIRKWIQIERRMGK